MSNAFTREFGVRQGRIEPVDGATEGDFAFVLGFDTPGRFELLDIGDNIEVRQTAEFQAGEKVVRVAVRLRGPASIPAGHKWVFELIIDGDVRATRDIHAGDDRELVEFMANCSKVGAGNKLLAMRLSLAAA
jgi:hypothetical protein